MRKFKIFITSLFIFLVLITNILHAGITTDRIGIGSVSNPTDLEVSGKITASSFTMTTSPTNGYVLQCDASGIASWADASDCNLLTMANTWTAPNSWLSSSTFNANSGDNDLQIKGQTNANVFFADASFDRIGVGTGTTNEKLTVNHHFSLVETTVPTASSGYGKIFCKSSDGQFYFQDDSGDTVLLCKHFVSIRDEKASGTAGGTFTSGAWQTRTLNAVQAASGDFYSLSSNQITLATGTYRILASAPAYYVDSHKARFQNVTDATTAIYGASALAKASTQASSGRSIVMGVITIAAQKTFELQHRCATTRNTDGYGQAANFGETEVYSAICIMRLK
ncbi:hypothetical protein ACFL58_00900 [Elusimicrobiota bacterium]